MSKPLRFWMKVRTTVKPSVLASSRTRQRSLELDIADIRQLHGRRNGVDGLLIHFSLHSGMASLLWAKADSTRLLSRPSIQSPLSPLFKFLLYLINKYRPASWHGTRKKSCHTAQAQSAVEADLARHICLRRPSTSSVDDVAHGRIMAAECANVGLGESETFPSTLACSTISACVHQHPPAPGRRIDWAGEGSRHRRPGLLAGFKPLATMAEPIRYHHTRWDKLVAAGVDARVIRQNQILIFDALTAPYYATKQHAAAQGRHSRAGARPGRQLSIRNWSRSSSKPRKSEAFWLLLEPRSIQCYLQDMLARGERCMAGVDELKHLTIFSCIVDAKSLFTAEHSLGVARLSRLLAEKMGVSAINCDKLEIAGLLHDSGSCACRMKSSTSRPNDLEETHGDQRPQFRNLPDPAQHRRFQEISRWAAYHHEEPDGTG